MRISDWSSDVCSSDLFVEVHAAPIDPVAAGAGKRIGNRKPAVVRAGKPAKGALGVGKPDRVAGKVIGCRSSIDRRPHLARLLVERTRQFAMTDKAVGSHRTKLAGPRGLEVFGPTERVQTTMRPD